MIYDPKRLAEVAEEISDWTLDQRRQYIAEMEKAFGPEAADQIKTALAEHWRKR